MSAVLVESNFSTPMPTVPAWRVAVLVPDAPLNEDRLDEDAETWQPRAAAMTWVLALLGAMAAVIVVWQFMLLG